MPLLRAGGIEKPLYQFGDPWSVVPMSVLHQSRSCWDDCFWRKAALLWACPLPEARTDMPHQQAEVAF